MFELCWSCVDTTTVLDLSSHWCEVFAIIWIWNALHKLMHLNAWSLDDLLFGKVWGNFKSLGVSLRSFYLDSSSCLSAPVCHEVRFPPPNAHSPPCCHDVLSKHMNEEAIGWTLWNHEPTGILPPLRNSSQVFGHRNTKVTNTELNTRGWYTSLYVYFPCCEILPPMWFPFF